MRTLSPILALTLSLGAAACGKVQTFADGSLVDGTTSDTGTTIDATTRGTVKVTTYDPGGGGAVSTGIPVLFIDTDGTLIRVASDTNGKAQADVLPGASVTAVWTTGTGTYEVETIRDIKPGDDLVMALQRDNTNPGVFTVTFPPLSGASAYYVYGPCGEVPANGTTATFSYLYSYCMQNPMNLMVVAYDQSYKPFQALPASGVTFSAGGSYTVSGAWQTLQTFNANFSDIPAIVTSLNMYRYSPDAFSFGGNAYGNPTTGTLSVSTGVPTITSTAHVATRVYDNSGSDQQIIQAVAGNALTYNLDIGTSLLPWVGQPTFDPSTGSLSVPVTGSGTPDATAMQIRYNRSGGDAGSTYVEWTVVGPDFADLTLPPLPADLADVAPQAGDQWYPFGAVMIELDDAAGYDDIRHDVLGLIGPINAYPAIGAATSGRGSSSLVRVSEWLLPQ